MLRPLRAALLAAVIVSMLPVHAASAQTSGAEGRINFTKAAESDFDSYTLAPSTARTQWMRDHYWRMRAYSPYFDSRTTWYPNAWAYRDAYAIYRGSPLATQHPDWVLKDPSGNRLYIPFACDGSSCTQYAADIGNPAWRRYYIDGAKATIAQGYKGIFVDDVNFAFKVGNGAGQDVAPIDPRTGAPMTHDAWQRYFAEFMEQLRAELPASAEIVQNQVYFHVGLSSPYVKRAIEAATYIEIERGVNDTGIRGGTGKFGFESVLAWIDYAHSRGKGVIYDVQADWGREYAIATYLVNSTGRDGLGMDVGAYPDGWWNGWDTSLGAPLNNRYAWNGLFRRDFERGSVFVNQPDKPTVTVAPGGSWKRLDGSTVTSVSLASRDGLVLLRDGVAAPPPAPVPPPPAPVPPPPAPVPLPPVLEAGLLGDLANGRPASASSVEVPVYSADKAVDATAATRFSSARRDGEWWQVDLGAPATVGKVAIEWEAAYASTYKILTSIDGKSWTQRASVSLSSAVTKVTTFAPTTARYVRILGVTRGTRYGISFWEVHVYGDAAPPARSALPPAPTAPTSGSTSPTPPATSPRRPRRAKKPSSVRDRAAVKQSVSRCMTQAKRRYGRALPKHRAACRLRAKRRAAARRS